MAKNDKAKRINEGAGEATTVTGVDRQQGGGGGGANVGEQAPTGLVPPGKGEGVTTGESSPTRESSSK